MVNREIAKKITDELTIAYLGKGVPVPGSLDSVAESLADAIPFADAGQVHEIFKRAKMVETIPTQKTLYEAWRNYGEEYLKYRNAAPSGTAALEGPKDSRAAWLPAEEFRRHINLTTAIKNYCHAARQNVYYLYCKSHEKMLSPMSTKERKIYVYARPSEANSFDSPIKKCLKELYRKYIRELPAYDGYPAGADLNLGLFPPTAAEFKWMLDQEETGW